MHTDGVPNLVCNVRVVSLVTLCYARTVLTHARREHQPIQCIQCNIFSTLEGGLLQNGMLMRMMMIRIQQFATWNQ